MSSGVIGNTFDNLHGTYAGHPGQEPSRLQQIDGIHHAPDRQRGPLRVCVSLHIALSLSTSLNRECLRVYARRAVKDGRCVYPRSVASEAVHGLSQWQSGSGWKRLLALSELGCY